MRHQKFNYLLADDRLWKGATSSDASSISSISARQMKAIIEHLKMVQYRESTKRNYLSVWRKFNEFVINLDVRPLTWEECASLFGAFLVEKGIQSSTLRSYMSAIKKVLMDDGYPWNDNKLMLSVLTRGCRIVNDKVRTRLPIQAGLLEMMLFELHRIFNTQYYLEILYKTIFVTAYYGLFCIGEITDSPYCIKAKNVNIADNKNKILFILHSSKTHGHNNKPQRIKISAAKDDTRGQKWRKKRHFCPFQLSREYMNLRGNYSEDSDNYFIFRDRQSVKSAHVRKVLRTTLSALGLNPLLYNTNSFHAGCAVDMLKFTDLQTVKLAGRWKSNTVYKYLSNYS